MSSARSMNSHRRIFSRRDFGTVGRPWPINTPSLVFACPMFPDIELMTAIHARGCSPLTQPLERGRLTSMPRPRSRQTLLMGLILPTPPLAMRALMQASHPGLPPMLPGPALWGRTRKTLLATGQTPAANCCTN